MALLLVPSAHGLSTASVYAELDRLRPEAPSADPAGLAELAAGPLEELAQALHNDLEPAALSLRPELAEVLDGLLGAGALGARISGSGPTAFGVFADRAAAEAAAAGFEGALVAEA